MKIPGPFHEILENQNKEIRNLNNSAGNSLTNFHIIDFKFSSRKNEQFQKKTSNSKFQNKI
jgi:hypothetical protein